MLVRELNDAVVPDRGRPRRSTQPPEHFLTESGTVLWQELGAKCVYVSTVSQGGAGWGHTGTRPLQHAPLAAWPAWLCRLSGCLPA